MPKDSDAIAMRAALMLTTGDAAQINQAVSDLQSLVVKKPDNHLLHYNLARAYLAKNDPEQARLQLEAAIKLRPDFLVARNMLGRIYIGKKDFPAALKEAEEIIAVNSNDVEARLTRSSALMALGDSLKARDEIDSILQMAPNNPDARYQSGFLAWQQKNYKLAQDSFAELSKINPKDSRGLLGTVETLASENRLGEGIKLVEDAAAREPARKDLQVALANLYVRDSRYDAAIARFQELLKADPKSADLLLRLAETQRRKGDINGAIDTFRRASEMAPTDFRPMLQVGLLLDGTGRRDQAKPAYEQVLKLQPDQPVALNNLAFIKAESGQDLDEALTMAQRARQGMPNSPDVMDTLGWIYLKKNLSDDAVRTFRGPGRRGSRSGLRITIITEWRCCKRAISLPRNGSSKRRSSSILRRTTPGRFRSYWRACRRATYLVSRSQGVPYVAPFVIFLALIGLSHLWPMPALADEIFGWR